MCDCVSLYDILSLLLCSASTLELDSLLGSGRAGERASGCYYDDTRECHTNWMGWDGRYVPGMCYSNICCLSEFPFQLYPSSTHPHPLPPARRVCLAAGWPSTLAGGKRSDCRYLLTYALRE